MGSGGGGERGQTGDWRREKEDGGLGTGERDGMVLYKGIWFGDGYRLGMNSKASGGKPVETGWGLGGGGQTGDRGRGAGDGGWGKRRGIEDEGDCFSKGRFVMTVKLLANDAWAALRTGLRVKMVEDDESCWGVGEGCNGGTPKLGCTQEKEQYGAPLIGDAAKRDLF